MKQRNEVNHTMSLSQESLSKFEKLEKELKEEKSPKQLLITAVPVDQKSEESIKTEVSEDEMKLPQPILFGPPTKDPFASLRKLRKQLERTVSMEDEISNLVFLDKDKGKVVSDFYFKQILQKFDSYFLNKNTDCRDTTLKNPNLTLRLPSVGQVRRMIASWMTEKRKEIEKKNRTAFERQLIRSLHAGHDPFLKNKYYAYISTLLINSKQ